MIIWLLLVLWSKVVILKPIAMLSLLLLCKIDKTTSIRFWVAIKYIKSYNNTSGYLEKWHKEKKNFSIYFINFCKRKNFKCIRIDVYIRK